MNRHERTAFLRSDEDDPDYLRDKPMGRCPWCGAIVRDTSAEFGWFPSGHAVSASYMAGRCHWDMKETITANRARYAEQREAEAKIEERMNRELRGSDGPY